MYISFPGNKASSVLTAFLGMGFGILTYMCADEFSSHRIDVNGKNSFVSIATIIGVIANLVTIIVGIVSLIH